MPFVDDNEDHILDLHVGETKENVEDACNVTRNRKFD